MSHISTQQLSEMAGITKRHCQRLLIAGHVPDAVRTSGGHWSIPDNAKVRKWYANQRENKHERIAARLRFDSAITTKKAKNLNGLHPAFLSSVNGAKSAINDALMASVEIGEYIKQIPRNKRISWLRENCPLLNQKQIAAYVSIANTYKKRKNSVIDHRFFTLLNIIDNGSNGLVMSKNKQAKLSR